MPASSPRSTSPRRPRTGGPTLTIHVNGQQYIWRYGLSRRAAALLIQRDGRAHGHHRGA
jgi:hypothetical protein